MSLLDDYMTECTFLDRVKAYDEYENRYIDTYRDGITFKAAIRQDNSMQAKIAQKQGVTELYTITTSRALTLNFHDVIRRESDKQTFRITSNGAETKTPKTAGLDMRQVTAEIFEIPKGA